MVALHFTPSSAGSRAVLTAISASSRVFARRELRLLDRERPLPASLSDSAGTRLNARTRVCRAPSCSRPRRAGPIPNTPRRKLHASEAGAPCSAFRCCAKANRPGGDRDRERLLIALRPASWCCIRRRRKSSTARMQTGAATFRTSHLPSSDSCSEQGKRWGEGVVRLLVFCPRPARKR